MTYEVSLVVVLLFICFVSTTADLLFCERIKKKIASFEVELEILKRGNKSNDTK